MRVLLSGCQQNRVNSNSTDTSALDWLTRVVDWVTGDNPDAERTIQEQAARLQLCETLKAVTHGDLHLDNVMVLGRQGAEYPCLIDFETTRPAHLLRDFGRFAGAMLFRTYEWDEEECGHICAAIARGAETDYKVIAETSGSESESVTKTIQMIGDVWRSYLQHWRGGARPLGLEVAATLICSFLPFARYPDTSESSARLALSLSGGLIGTIAATTEA